MCDNFDSCFPTIILSMIVLQLLIYSAFKNICFLIFLHIIHPDSVNTHTYIQKYIHRTTYIHVCVYVVFYMCMCVCIYIYIYIYICVCVCVCVCVRVCVYLYIYRIRIAFLKEDGYSFNYN